MDENKLKSNTLLLFKAFISSHAVFNALTFIQNKIADDEKRAALKALSGFANFIRKTADEVDEPFRAHEKELDMLKYYLMLEQWRFGDSLIINADMTGGITKVPAFIYVPFIEQIILIGLASTNEMAELKIESHEDIGLKVSCNFNLPNNYAATITPEQTNRRTLLLDRIQSYSPEYSITMDLDKNIGLLTIKPN